MLTVILNMGIIVSDLVSMRPLAIYTDEVTTCGIFKSALVVLSSKLMKYLQGHVVKVYLLPSEPFTLNAIIATSRVGCTNKTLQPRICINSLYASQ